MYNSTLIAYSPNLKFLGVILTENLKWHAHIVILCKSLNKAYFMIKYLKEAISYHSEFCIMQIFSLYEEQYYILVNILLQ
jgi:hypothetical protein